MIFIGADPGGQGGIAALQSDGAVALPPIVMPMAGDDVNAIAINNYLEKIIWSFGEVVLAAVEKVGAMPKQGLASTFKFGCRYGVLRGALGAKGVGVRLVTPQEWKSSVLHGLPHDKEGAIAFCANRWPTLSLIQPGCRKAHDGIADALCIAEWLRRSEVLR